MLSFIFLINIFILISLVNGEIINPCQSLSEIKEIDECYMDLALDLGLKRNPRAPFGTIIVNHETNDITCIGVNENDKDILLHGTVFNQMASRVASVFICHSFIRRDSSI